ncbi:hypothetical protein L2E81_12220 [Planktothrix agardhii 1033]|nr:hypothetical protein [Planktothrix agardhii 1033]
MMGKLQRKLVENLISLDSAKKREIGNRIVRALGGDPTPQATGLPRRRGTGDGGIDGRIPIKIRQRVITEKLKQKPDGLDLPVRINESEFKEVETNAGFNIKIEKECFTRDTINAFVEDLRREGMFAGVIVTASGLCPDAEWELQRHNNNDMDLCHILLEDLLSGDISCQEIEFVVGDLVKQLRVSLREYITSESPWIESEILG